MNREEIQPERQSGLTRREILKRGAVFGGALVWATPVVQTVGMRAASAQEASPACNVWYAVKLERIDDSTDWRCIDIYNQSANPPGECLDAVNLEPSPVPGGCNFIESASLAPQDADDNSWTVTLNGDCQWVLGEGYCSYKVGNVFGGCLSGCEWDFETRTLTFNADTNISHVEFAFCCN
jgi:hypothetical protein